MFLLSPQGDPGPGAFPSWAPPKAVSLPCLTQACVYAVQPPPAFRIPPVPGREASSLAPGMAPAPRSESRAPLAPAQTTQRQGLAEPSGASGQSSQAGQSWSGSARGGLRPGNH